MKILNYSKPNDLSKLHDELLAAVPSVRPVAGMAVMIVQGNGDDITLTVPDSADETAITAVVAAHDPTLRVVVDPDTELDAAIGAATTLAGLKAALLGSRGGRVKARPGA